jgi:uncharacterized Zn finger protein
MYTAMKQPKTIYHWSGDKAVDDAAMEILQQQFHHTDRIDSGSVEQIDGAWTLIVHANKGNVGSKNCEFVYRI